MGGTDLPESQAQLLQSGKLDEREKQLDDTTSGSDESNSVILIFPFLSTRTSPKLTRAGIPWSNFRSNWNFFYWFLEF